MTDAQQPDLVVGLIKLGNAAGRSTDEDAEIVPNVAELTAIVHNQGERPCRRNHHAVLGTRG
jgi:hypothetical protein